MNLREAHREMLIALLIKKLGGKVRISPHELYETQGLTLERIEEFNPPMIEFRIVEPVIDGQAVEPPQGKLKTIRRIR